MKRHFRIANLCRTSLLLGLAVLGSGEAGEPLRPRHATVEVAAKPKEPLMWMTIGERRFDITLADSDAARALAAHLPLTLDMEELNGNEKHAQLPASLPVKATRPGTIRNGDLMLYGRDTLVVFYATFNSNYSYTPIGRVDNPAALAQALGPRNAKITFSGQSR